MAAERPRRRITQPCLEYNGGLLHQEEIMLRRAMYASLNESKKPSPSKLPNHHSTTSKETSGSNGFQYPTTVDAKADTVSCDQSVTPSELDNNNGGSESGKSIDTNHSALKACPEMKKKMKVSKEPSKLLNYVIKKKKEKGTNSSALLRTLSPNKLSGSSETSCPASLNGKSRKKKKRQRGALAVFVAMNKSAGGKIHKNPFSGSDKELLLKAKKKRRRKRKALNNDVCNKTDSMGVASQESPAKKPRKDDKKPVRLVQAQRKFAKTHPLSPSSMRLQEERSLLSTSFARAKTEDFLTFLCLRDNPVLPKELEFFNNPCLPMSPLSDDQEDNSSPPSPTQSQSSMSNLSNPSSTIQKSFSDSPAPSVDSPAMGEGPSWESGVVRMYADGPQGLAGNGKELKKYDELQPSDEADDPRELTKSVTPPLAFRVSSRPTNWTGCRVKDKQLPRPIPKPFAVKPSLTGTSTSRTSFSPTGTVNTGNIAIPPPPPLLHPTESTSCSPPPPPLLYIPAAAQRVTHLHGPPTLQRFPSTSPTREQESGELADQQRFAVDRNAGPPPLKRFPPVVVEHESAEKGQDSDGNSSNELFSVRSSSPELRSLSSRSSSKSEPKAVSPSVTNAVLASRGRSSSSLSDLTKIPQMDTESESTASRWKNKEMPLLRRHSSASQCSVGFEDLVNLPEGSPNINSRSSPPQLQRVSVPADTGRLELSKTSAGASETSGDRLETSRSRLKSSCSRNEPSETRREISDVPIETSGVGRGSPGFRLETFGDRTKTSGSRLETSGSGLQTPGDRLQTSGSPFDASCSRLSPSFPSLPPRLVRHSPTRLGHPEANLAIASHHGDLPISGDFTQLRASPLAFFTQRNSPETFHENNYPTAIPVADGRPSPLLLSTQGKNKSTYVFSNRQSYLPTANEPRPLQVSHLIMPSNYSVNMAPNRGEVRSRGFQSVDDLRRSDERRSFVRNVPHSMQNQYAGNHSTSRMFRPHESFSEASRQCGDSLGSKRIPSPRSDLFGRISHEPVNSSCMSRIGVPSPGSPCTGDQPTVVRSTIRHKENTLESFPPMWSHLESPYSIPSIAALNSPPKPYSFSPNIPPQVSVSPRLFETQSVGSRSNSSTPTLEGYSLAPTQSADHQRVPVIQNSNLNKGASPDGVQLGLRAGQHENFRTYHLPSAFQAGDSWHDSRTNAIFSESAFSSTSAKECLMRQSLLNGRSSADLNRKSSSPLLHHTEPPTRSPSSKSPSLNKDTPSPLPRHNELHSNPPSSKSPSLKVKQSNASEVAVAGGVTDPKKSCNSSVMAGKKTLGSKQKQSVGPSSIFHPSEEEFKDPVSYIKMIRPEAERFGACVIVPPESWKPEFQMSDSVRFNSECQLIHRLQGRWGPVEEELACIKKHLDQQSISLTPMPQIGGYELDLPQFSRVVRQFGGLQKVIDSKKWTKVADTLKIPRAAQDRIGKLQDIYCKYLLSYDLLPQDEKSNLLRQVEAERETKAERGSDSWIVKGRNLSLVPFQRLARNVQGHFFKNLPTPSDVEREFWKIVHDRESYVSVHRGTLDTNQEHSCFSTDKGDPYSKLGWNLNVLPHLPGSVVRHLGFVQDITVPWLQFDMLFSVKPWQVHPLAFCTVDYLHSGAEKIWYSVPAGEKKNLESVLEQDDDKAAETSLADKMVSPSSLGDKGVAVTRIVQKQGQFVIVFPEAYHSTISCGYSISEAVAFAPPDWVLIGSKRYKELQDPAWLNEFTYDRLLVGIAQELSDETQEVVQCLLEELKLLRDEEKFFMTKLLELGLVETVDREEKSTGTSGKKSKKSLTSWTQADSSCVLYCEECDRPCCLSAVTGEDEPQVLCLKHAVDHIRAKASPEGFRILSRYDTARLDELVGKVEERLKKLKDTSS